MNSAAKLRPCEEYRDGIDNLKTETEEAMSWEEIGRAFGVSKPAIIACGNRAIRKLWRRPIELQRERR